MVNPIASHLELVVPNPGDLDEPVAGQRLRKWRADHQLTLMDVSNATGIPVPALSKFENGKQSLGYPRLLALAELLGVELSQLIAGARAQVTAPARALGRRSINRIDERPTFDDAEFLDRYLATDLLHKAMTPIICDVSTPPSAPREVWSRHAGEEFVLVLEGVLEIQSEIYAPLRLETGDSIYFDATVGHNYYAVGRRACRFLSVCQSAVPPRAREEPRAPSTVPRKVKIRREIVRGRGHKPR